MPIPTEAQRFVDLCTSSHRNVILTFQPQPIRTDEPPPSDCTYYYWSDGSGAVYDHAENKPHLLPDGD